MDVPCPLHWVLRAGDDGLLAVLQNTTGGDADRRAPDGYPPLRWPPGRSRTSFATGGCLTTQALERISGKFKQLTKRSPRPFDTKPQSKYNKR